MNPYIYKATLVKIIDGDTFDCDIDLGFNVWMHKQRVRLYNIDTPEKALGLKAKQLLTDLLGDKFFISSLGEGKSRGKYGRILGTPYTADGQDICQILVDSGLAVYYDGGKKTKVWA